MNTIIGSSKIKILNLIIIMLIIFISSFTYNNYVVYNSISVSVKEQAVIEYGSAKYNINDLIEDVDGKIVSVKQDIDTKTIGEQEVVVEVEKNNIVKEIPIVVEVVDTTAPVIKLNEEKITIENGEEYDLLNNVSSVFDEIDGDLEFQQVEIVNEDVDTNYYTIMAHDNFTTSGIHKVTVRAVDKCGNISTVDYDLEVKEPVVKYNETVYYDLPANASANNITSLAYSLLGHRYIAGGTTPAGFDCSGFVQYVYSQFGISVSRSATTQIYDGVAVSYENAQPGDILSWGYSNGTVTHSALYVGNGLMIHAANPSQGVILSDVAAWTRGSGTMVLSVRRI